MNCASGNTQVSGRRGPALFRRRPQRLRNTHERLGFAAALAIVVEQGKRAQVPAQAHCPRCGKTGSTHEDFGTRIIDGRARPQSWCRNCRSARGRKQGQLGLELDPRASNG